LAKQQTELRRWALIGAEQRLVQLAAEASAIHRAFPELRQGGIKPQGGGSGIQAQKARWAKQKSVGAAKKK
jgi:hypothetical protein